MRKDGEVNIAEIILMVVIVGLLAAYFFGWISFGQSKEVIPTELPQTPEEQTEEENNVNEFQQCTIPSVGSYSEDGSYRIYTKSTECNLDQTKYYNRNCTVGWWRCMEGVEVGKYLCSYACDGSKYCGDAICGNGETEITCQDCNPSVGFLGSLKFG